MHHCGVKVDTIQFNVNRITKPFFYIDSVSCYSINLYSYINCYDSLRWDFGDGAISQLENPIHTYSQTGTFSVSLTSWLDGIDSTFTSTVQLDCSANIEDINNDEIIVFPNPGKTSITIILFNKENHDFIILNSLGAVVLKDKIENGTKILNIESFASGIYFVKVNFNIIKLVIE